MLGNQYLGTLNTERAQRKHRGPQFDLALAHCYLGEQQRGNASGLRVAQAQAHRSFK